MPTFRRGIVGFVSAVIVIAIVSCRPALTNGTSLQLNSQLLATESATPAVAQSTQVIWGRVPYCSCLVNSATEGIAKALQEADLSVNLQELSPRDDWLYFAVTFDHAYVTAEQVRISMIAGGAEVLDGPP